MKLIQVKNGYNNTSSGVSSSSHLSEPSTTSEKSSNSLNGHIENDSSESVNSIMQNKELAIALPKQSTKICNSSPIFDDSGEISKNITNKTSVVSIMDLYKDSNHTRLDDKLIDLKDDVISVGKSSEQKAMTYKNKISNKLCKSAEHISNNLAIKDATMENLNISTYNGNTDEDNDGLIIKVKYGSSFQISPITNLNNNSVFNQFNQMTSQNNLINDFNLENSLFDSTNHAISSEINISRKQLKQVGAKNNKTKPIKLGISLN